MLVSCSAAAVNVGNMKKVALLTGIPHHFLGDAPDIDTSASEAATTFDQADIEAVGCCAAGRSESYCTHTHTERENLFLPSLKSRLSRQLMRIACSDKKIITSTSASDNEVVESFFG